jgi:stage II sporulation protein D
MPALVCLLSLLVFIHPFSVLADHAPSSEGVGFASPPALRVRVLKKVHAFQISGEGIRVLDGRLPEGNGKESSAPLWSVVCDAGKIRLKSKGYLESSSKKESVQGQLSDRGMSSTQVSFEKKGGVLHLGKNTYRDVLHVRLVDPHSCDVMNEVDLEKYLDGLVNSEFSSKWHEESIAAQVIAARTYAYHQLLDARAVRKSQFFDLDSTTTDQVYEGTRKESSRASRIAERTRGLILATYQPQKERWEPVKAFYHSACGGLTELPERVWKKKFAGFKKQVSCDFCKESPVYQWSLNLSAEEITRAVLQNASERERKLLKLHTLQKMIQPVLVSIELDPVLEKSRVLRVKLTWKTDSQVFTASVSGARFRDWIGNTRLKSTWFATHSVSPHAGRESRWQFEGWGHGHGVGMCQWGAKRMGERGFTYASILQYYYPAAMLKKIW